MYIQVYVDWQKYTSDMKAPLRKTLRPRTRVSSVICSDDSGVGIFYSSVGGAKQAILEPIYWFPLNNSNHQMLFFFKKKSETLKTGNGYP